MKPACEIGAHIDIDALGSIDIAPVRLQERPRRLKCARAYPLPRLLLACAIAWLVEGNAGATIIVIYRSEGQIIVGADGVTQNATDPTDRYTSCKIRRVTADTYFSLAGVRRFGYRLDVAELVRKSLRATGASAQGKRRFDHLVGKALAQELRVLPQRKYAAVLATLEGFGSLSVVTVLTFRMLHGGIPEVSARDFHVPAHRRQGTMAVKVVTCPPCAAIPMLSTYGWPIATRAVNARWIAEPGYFSRPRPGGVADAIRELLDVAIATGSDCCGPPISILRLTAEGADWVERGECTHEEYAGDQTPAPVPVPR